MTVLDSVRRGHRGLYRFAVAMTALSAVLVIAALVDHRVVDGAPVWFKPLKFAVAVASYAAALSWLLDRAGLTGRLPRRCADVTVATIALEMVAIVGQAARGQGSHFNHEGTLNTVVSSAMGATIAVFFVFAVILAVVVVRSGRLDPLTRRGIKAGIALSVAGMGAGIAMSINGAHTVGAPDGGPGLPFTGWSTVAGDLRIPHFVGLHALEVLPLLAFALAAVGRGRWTVRTQLRLQAVGTSAYAAGFVILFGQALAGEPLLHPGAATLLALVSTAALVAAGAMWAIRDSRTFTGATTGTRRRGAIARKDADHVLVDSAGGQGGS